MLDLGTCVLCNPSVDTSNFHICFLVGELDLELFQLVIDCESQRLSFRVSKSKLRCKNEKMSSQSFFLLFK